MSRPGSQAVADDGLPAQTIGAWAESKHRLVETYARMFSTAMKNRWKCRTYIDLFAGPGHATIKGTSRRVLTSPLLALGVPDPFSNYIFCEKNRDLADALTGRAGRVTPPASLRVLNADANSAVMDIENHIPPACISFCFVDPFGCDVRLDTIRRLSSGRRMDFLVLLALGMDATRNWERYLLPGNNRMSVFLGDNDWRSRWAESNRMGRTPIRFLLERYAVAMTGLGYLNTPVEDMHEVRLPGKEVRLYYLAFFSKHRLGLAFWRKAKQSASDQMELAV